MEVSGQRVPPDEWRYQGRECRQTNGRLGVIAVGGGWGRGCDGEI